MFGMQRVMGVGNWELGVTSWWSVSQFVIRKVKQKQKEKKRARSAMAPFSTPRPLLRALFFDPASLFFNFHF